MTSLGIRSGPGALPDGNFLAADRSSSTVNGGTRTSDCSRITVGTLGSRGTECQSTAGNAGNSPLAMFVNVGSSIAGSRRPSRLVTSLYGTPQGSLSTESQSSRRDLSCGFLIAILSNFLA